MKKTYPHLYKTLYAVYVGEQPRARCVLLVEIKKDADMHARVLRGAGENHVIVVPYDKR